MSERLQTNVPISRPWDLTGFPDSDKGTSGRSNFEVGSTEDSAPTLETGAYGAHLNQVSQIIDLDKDAHVHKHHLTREPAASSRRGTAMPYSEGRELEGAP